MHNGASDSFQLEGISEDLVAFEITLKAHLLNRGLGTLFLPCPGL